MYANFYFAAIHSKPFQPGPAGERGGGLMINDGLSNVF